jgi:hypothetical protein
VFFSANDSLNIVYNSMFGSLILGAPGYNGTAFLEITISDDSSAFDQDTLKVIVLPPTGIFDPFYQIIPEEYVLLQNYPNPFNPVTHIRFGLPEAGEVKIELFDILGQRVALLVDERKPAGYHTIDFDSSNLASGIYLYRIQAGDYVDSKKMVLMK